MLMSQVEKVERFAQVLEADQIQDRKDHNLACEANIKNCRVSVIPGRKYTKVNVGDSGKYMIETETEKIYAIKAYGVIHRGYCFGTLDTIDDWFWGGYRAVRKAV